MKILTNFKEIPTDVLVKYWSRKLTTSWALQVRNHLRFYDLPWVDLLPYVLSNHRRQAVIKQLSCEYHFSLRPTKSFSILSPQQSRPYQRNKSDYNINSTQMHRFIAYLTNYPFSTPGVRWEQKRLKFHDIQGKISNRSWKIFWQKQQALSYGKNGQKNCRNHITPFAPGLARAGLLIRRTT